MIPSSQANGGLGTVFEDSIILENNLNELRRLADFVHRFSQRANLPKECALALDLALTEWIGNVVVYAFPKGTSAQIPVRVSADAALLVAEIEDTGAPFNPLSVEPVDVSLPLDQKPIGGLGVHIIRQYMDDLAYERLDGKNRVTMRKRLRTTAND